MTHQCDKMKDLVAVEISVIDGDWCLDLYCEENGVIEINYCPFCGQKLGE